MAGENLFTRIPPSSTGDRIHLRQSVILPYANRTTAFVEEDFYTLATSGIRIHLHDVYATDSTNGFLWVHFSPSAIFNGQVPTTGENITDLDGNVVATVAAGYYEINTNASVLTGWNNPNQGQFVDQFGSAYVRTEEGNLGLDAFGKLRTSGATILGEYTFTNSVLPDQFSNTLVGAGTITHEPTRKQAIVSVGTSINDQATHTSNTYHHYVPGSSHQFIGTYALNDTGKAGLVRNWGLFDNKNGFMFSERNGEFGLVIRSSATGTTVDTFISQSDFNGDTLDGTGLSGMTIDRTYDNIYWIDVQWLGGGRVRFGTYDKGARIVMHEYYGGNISIYSISQTASLPVCMSIKNTAGTSGPSEIRSWCQAVYTETTLDIEEIGRPNTTALSATITGSAPAGEDYYYIGTLTPKLYLSGSNFNRNIYFPTSVEYIAWDATTGADVILDTEIYYNPVMTGLSLENTEHYSTVDKDQSATFIGGNLQAAKKYIRGVGQTDLTKNYVNIGSAFKNSCEDGGVVTSNFTNITNAATASATFDLGPFGQINHREDRALTISGVGGMTEINGLSVYPKNTSISSSLLFLDAAHTQPVNTTASGSYTSGGILKGTRGGNNYFVLVAEKQVASSNDIIVKAVVNWREIDQ